MSRLNGQIGNDRMPDVAVSRESLEGDAGRRMKSCEPTPEREAILGECVRYLAGCTTLDLIAFLGVMANHAEERVNNPELPNLDRA